MTAILLCAAEIFRRFRVGNSSPFAEIGFLKGRSSVHCSHCHGYRLPRGCDTGGLWRRRGLLDAKSAIDQGGQSRRYFRKSRWISYPNHFFRHSKNGNSIKCDKPLLRGLRVTGGVFLPYCARDRKFIFQPLRPPSQRELLVGSTDNVLDGAGHQGADDRCFDIDLSFHEFHPGSENRVPC